MLSRVHLKSAFADRSHCRGGTPFRASAAICLTFGDRLPTLISRSIHEIRSLMSFEVNLYSLGFLPVVFLACLCASVSIRINPRF